MNPVPSGDAEADARADAEADVNANADAALPLDLLARAFPQTLVAMPSGGHVAVRRAGSTAAGAPVVVLLHGISSGAASWLGVAVALATECSVVAWDAPGYGESAPLQPDAPSAADYAKRLDELLGALDIRSCVLVGHSLGALMAVAHAADDPTCRIRRLVLISPARGYGAPGREAARTRVLAERLDALRQLGVAGLAQRSPARLLSAEADAAARAWVRWNTGRLTAAGYAQAVHMLCGEDLTRHAGIGVPVEVHCGDADTVTTPAACNEVAAAFGTTCAAIAGAGHASPVERPEAVAGLIASVVARLAADGVPR